MRYRMHIRMYVAVLVIRRHATKFARVPALYWQTRQFIKSQLRHILNFIR